MTLATIANVVYGMDVSPNDGAKYSKAIEDAIDILVEIGSVAAYTGKSPTKRRVLIPY